MTTGSAVEECYQRVGSYFIHMMTYTDTNKQAMEYTFVPAFYAIVLSDSWWQQCTKKYSNVLTKAGRRKTYIK